MNAPIVPTSSPSPASTARPARVETYLRDVVEACTARRGLLASLILFGSTSSGGYSPVVSDVDLFLVLHDDVSAPDRRWVISTVSDLEIRHGLSKHHSGREGVLERFADLITANVRSFFVCTRGDLLSGEPWRILDIPRTQGRFVDRIVVPSIVASGTTVWGEELLDRVPLPQIRRADVVKSLVGLLNQMLFITVAYPLLPRATHYAMNVLKRSVHSCYFCHHRRSAPLAEEISFLETRHGPMQSLARLRSLRSDYRPSFGFVVSCLPTLVRLHLGATLDGAFPRDARPRA
jgi:hypothetical protein